MQDNPFEYRLLAKGDRFVDRESELDTIIKTVKSGQNITIYSPRRYGKSSLILKSFERLKEDRAVVYIDFNRINDISELADSIVSDVVKNTFSSFEKGFSLIKDTLTSLRPTFTPLDDGHVKISLKIVETEKDLEKALSFPQTLAEKKDIRIVLAMDEFQRISTLNGGRLERLFRSVIQEQDRVTYIFSGSQVNMLKEIFEEGDRPFFKSTKIMKLGRIPKKPFIEYIIKNFENNGVKVDRDIIDEILRLTDGHPMRTKELCFELWNQEMSKYPSHSLEEVLHILIDNDMYLEQTWNMIKSSVHRRALEAIAYDEKPYSYETIQKYGLKGNSHVQRALKTLERQGILYENEIVDPFFREWIKRKTGSH